VTRFKYLMVALALSTLALSVVQVRGTPSSGFTYRQGDWFDSFGIDRSYYGGPDGYLPNLANETIGDNAELAYSTGVWFKDNYLSTSGRAEAILKYVQTWVEYGYDSDNVVRDGVSQDEWAWNADEMAHQIDQSAGTKAVGDCEDMAFLCCTIYTAAGIDAAVVDAPEHVACLIWLPDYANADYYWDIGDGRGHGWIWAEATGNSNPLGWTPEDYSNGEWSAYPVSQAGVPTVTARPPNIENPDIPLPPDLIVLGVIAITVLLVLFIAAGSRKKKTRYLHPSPYQEYPYPPPPPPQ